MTEWEGRRRTRSEGRHPLVEGTPKNSTRRARYLVPLLLRLLRASFSVMAATTNAMTEVSIRTQCSFNSRWTDFGMRVAN